jgi:MFS family permease
MMLLGALRERNFRLYFVGQTTSSMGNAMVGVALVFAILRLTGSAGDLGIVLTSSAVSQVIFLLAGGVIADRVPRRLALLGSDIVRFVAEAVLAAFLITTHPALWLVVVLVFVQGAASAVFMPASSGIVPQMVTDSQLQAANSLMQTASSAASVVGPALAGLIVVATSPGWAIAVDAATYGVSVVTLAMLRIAKLKRGQRHRFVEDLREGWDEFRSRDWYWKLVAGAAVFNFLFAIYVVLGPVASLRYYSGAKSWSIIATAAGVGAVVGGLVSTRIRSRFPMRIGLPLALMLALPSLAIGLRMPVPVVAGVAACGGAGLVVFSALFETTVQRLIPEAVLSRVVSYDWFGSMIAFPIGLAVAAPLASSIGLRPILVIAALVEIASLLAVLSVRSVWSLQAPAADVPAEATA